MPPLQPEPKNAAIRHAKAFMDCLTDESAYYITHLPKNAFKPNQLAALRRIYQHLNESDPNAHDNAPSSSRSGQASAIDGSEDHQPDPNAHDDASSSSRSGQAPAIDGSEDHQPDSSTSHNITIGPKKGPGRPRKLLGTSSIISPYSAPWGAIMLIKEFKLDDDLRNLLVTTTTDNAASFLNAPHPSLANPTEQRIPDVKVFSSFCIKVSEMPKRKVMDRVSWLFLVLTVGDMADALFGGNIWSTKKSHVLKNAVIKEHNIDIYLSIEPMRKIVSQLVFICRTFGIGCLFYLESVLNENFLKNRVTQSGEAYENAMQHFKRLEFPKSIEESGANAIGDAIRSHLCIVYKINQVGLYAVDTSDSGEGTMNSGDGQGTAGSGQGE